MYVTQKYVYIYYICFLFQMILWTKYVYTHTKVCIYFLHFVPFSGDIEEEDKVLTWLVENKSTGDDSKIKLLFCLCDHKCHFLLFNCPLPYMK